MKLDVSFDVVYKDGDLSWFDSLLRLIILSVDSPALQRMNFVKQNKLKCL